MEINLVEASLVSKLHLMMDALCIAHMDVAEGYAASTIVSVVLQSIGAP